MIFNIIVFRFALDITDAEIESWLDSRGYQNAKRRTAAIFARALRDYGWMITDTSGFATSVVWKHMHTHTYAHAHTHKYNHTHLAHICTCAA